MLSYTLMCPILTAFFVPYFVCKQWLNRSGRSPLDSLFCYGSGQLPSQLELLPTCQTYYQTMSEYGTKASD